MIIYIFGGYLITEGIFQEGTNKGKKWQSIKLFVGKTYNENEFPRSTVILKADKKLLDFISNLEQGCKLTLSFDENGKVVGITYKN